jgi:Ger(x)C family germination protein
MAEAMLNMNRFTSRTLTVSQCRAVLFSAEVAREGLAPYIGILSRWYEFRSTMMVFVTKGRADECLKIESPLERDPTQFLVKLATTAPEFGLGASFQVHDLLHQLGSYETEPVLPLIERRQPASAPRGGAAPAGDQGPPPATSGPGTSSIPPKEAVGLAGLAVLRTARMVGELSAQETAFYLMLTGRSLTSFLILPDPEVRGRFVTVQAKGIRRTIRVKRLFGPPEIAVSLEVPLELVEIQSTVDYTSRHLRGRLERTAEEQIERGCAAVVRRAQRELRADLFGWGSYVKNHFLTWPAWVEYDWLKRQFPQTRVEISVTARLRHPGSTFRPVRPVQAPGRPRRGPAGDVEVLQSLSVAPE